MENERFSHDIVATLHMIQQSVAREKFVIRQWLASGFLSLVAVSV